MVGVSWYEALAFARWLSDAMQSRGLLSRDWQVTLPSEAEWEKAARGTDGRRLPWLGDLIPAHANLQAAGIGHGNTVGLFPKEHSPYAFEELIGNVLEWTRSLWGTDVRKLDFAYPYRAADGREDLMTSDPTLRVIRGGVWYSQISAGCARRLRAGPNGRSTLSGFA